MLSSPRDILWIVCAQSSDGRLDAGMGWVGDVLRRDMKNVAAQYEKSPLVLEAIKLSNIGKFTSILRTWQ